MSPESFDFQGESRATAPVLTLQPLDESLESAMERTETLPAPESGISEPPPETTPVPKPSGWDIAHSSYAEGLALELNVVGYNRGGLLVDLGDVRGFVPASQLISFPRRNTGCPSPNGASASSMCTRPCWVSACRSSLADPARSTRLFSPSGSFGQWSARPSPPHPPQSAVGYPDQVW